MAGGREEEVGELADIVARRARGDKFQRPAQRIASGGDGVGRRRNAVNVQKTNRPFAHERRGHDMHGEPDGAWLGAKFSKMPVHGVFVGPPLEWRIAHPRGCDRFRSKPRAGETLRVLVVFPFVGNDVVAVAKAEFPP